MWDRYEKSLPMSTYIVAFVVFDFAHINSSQDGLQFRGNGFSCSCRMGRNREKLWRIRRTDILDASISAGLMHFLI